MEIYSPEIACGLSAWEEPTPCENREKPSKDQHIKGSPKSRDVCPHAHHWTPGRLPKSRTQQRPAQTQNRDCGDWAGLQ